MHTEIIPYLENINVEVQRVFNIFRMLKVTICDLFLQMNAKLLFNGNKKTFQSQNIPVRKTMRRMNFVQICYYVLTRKYYCPCKQDCRQFSIIPLCSFENLWVNLQLVTSVDPKQISRYFYTPHMLIFLISKHAIFHASALCNLLSTIRYSR